MSESQRSTKLPESVKETTRKKVRPIQSILLAATVLLGGASSYEANSPPISRPEALINRANGFVDEVLKPTLAQKVKDQLNTGEPIINGSDISIVPKINTTLTSINPNIPLLNTPTPGTYFEFNEYTEALMRTISPDYITVRYSDNHSSILLLRNISNGTFPHERPQKDQNITLGGISPLTQLLPHTKNTSELITAAGKYINIPSEGTKWTWTPGDPDLHTDDRAVGIYAKNGETIEITLTPDNQSISVEETSTF